MGEDRYLLSYEVLNVKISLKSMTNDLLDI